MSMNIAPPIPQVVNNAATPSTDALARTNAVREVIPATVQTEPYAPQKSREQEARSPINNNEDPATYEDIRNNLGNNRVIEEDPQNSNEQNQQQGEEPSADQEPSAEQDSSAEQNTSADEDPSNQEQTAQGDEDSPESKQQEAQEQRVIDQLKARDREVRAHEQAHAAVGGSLAGSPSYEYQTGPDGQKYAVGGEVSIDVAKTNDPESTIRKMQTVRAAALAPAEPSSQDRKVAAQASRNISEARAELITETAEQEQEQGQTKQALSPELATPGNNSRENNSEHTEQSTSGQTLPAEATQSNSNIEQAPAANDDSAQPSAANQAVEISAQAQSSNAQYPNKMDLARRFVGADNEDKTAQVVSQRYASSYNQQQNFFSVVA